MPSFDQIIGNEAVKSHLTKLVEKSRVPQSLLFVGQEGIGKSLFAESFARMLVRTDKQVHPDIQHFQPEGKIGMHTIQAMREFSDAVYMAPFEAKKKVLVIHDAHRMLATSANALLKTFEEPALDSVIILISHEPERLLPTVLSRCQTIRFQPVATDAIAEFLVQNKKMSKSDAERFAMRARGSIGKALNGASSNDHPVREMLLNLLSDGRLRSYSNCSLFAKEISDRIEARLRDVQDALQKQLIEAFTDKPSAVQKQMIEKEVDGALSMGKAAEAKTLFEALLSWYRDLQLLSVSGSPAYLINPDYQEKLKQCLQRGELLALEKVEKAVSEAILSLERSTSLHLCFENLFLKLTC